MQLRQSLRLNGRKVCNIKRADISQAGRNKATVCVVPSSHLPLTREASLVRSDGLLSFYNGCEDEKVGCNGRGKLGKDALSVCALSFARMQNHTSTHRPSPYEKREG